MTFCKHVGVALFLNDDPPAPVNQYHEQLILILRGTCIK